MSIRFKRGWWRKLDLRRQEPVKDRVCLMPNDRDEAAFQRLAEEVKALRLVLEDTRRSIREVRQLVGPFGVPMPDGTLLVQSLFGIKYLIDPLDLIIAPNLVVYRQWEADLSAMMAAYASPNLTFVDVGANFGYFSCLMGALIGNRGTGRIWAVEPNPNCVTLLRKNVSINWSMCPITVLPSGAGEKAAKLELIVPRNRSANGALKGKTKRAVGADEDVFKVEVKPLDVLLPPDLTVDLMKIDVEGHEWSVLAGARKVIERSPNIRIIMEWAPAQMKDAGYNASAMSDLFEALGLAVYLQRPGFTLAQPTGTPLTRSELASLGYENLVLQRRSEALAS